MVSLGKRSVKVGPSDVSSESHVLTTRERQAALAALLPKELLQQAALAFTNLRKTLVVTPQIRGYKTTYYLSCRLTLSFFTVTSELR